MNKSSTLILLLICIVKASLFAQTSSPFTPVNGMKIGPNYIVWEAEATTSPLGKWQIIKPGDSRYLINKTVAPIGKTHLEFTGNNHNSGPATSPLEYTFICPKTATYRLGARLYQRLEGQPDDKCNDVYVKMSGNFTSGNGVALDDLKHNQKFYGRGVDKWGALYNLEVHSTGSHAAAMYKLTEGEKYTLTVSGRAQRTNIDYWILYDTSMSYNLAPHVDIAVSNPEEYRPNTVSCKTIKAVDMKFTGIDGFTDAQKDNKAGVDILQIVERDAWAAAQYVYDGTNGQATFVLNTMLEKDGESTYRIKINGQLISQFTNTRIHGTDIEDYTIQSHSIDNSSITLNDGDIIQVEINNTSNGLVPEDNTTATSRGRWVSLEICTTGTFTNYHLSLNKESVALMPGISIKLDVEAVLPNTVDSKLNWKSKHEEIAAVDENGKVESIAEGITRIIVSTEDGTFKDSCDVNVLIPEPYNDDPMEIPGYIEVEDFDIGGEGATYHDTDDENEGGQYRTDVGVDIEECSQGGYNVGWTQEGEWLMYTIEVSKTGVYNFEANVASMDKEGKFHIEINGNDITGTKSFSATGGWQEWTTINIDNLTLTEGEKLLTLVFESSGWNIDWLRLYKTGEVVYTTDVSLSNSSIKIKKDESIQLTAEVLPSNATDVKVNWSSLDKTIATVNENGQVTGVSAGETTITAESNDGASTSSCTVEVSDDVSVKRIEAHLAQVYPNPTEGRFIIKQASEYPIKQVVIYNVQGQKVYERLMTGESQTEVVLEENVKGIYVVNIISQEKMQTISVLVE